jgi:KDO2-lipid IV(A) lauroyltransferase
LDPPSSTRRALAVNADELARIAMSTLDRPLMTASFRVLLAFLSLAGRLPLRVLHAAGSVLGLGLWLVRGRERRVTEVNLRLLKTCNGARTGQRTRHDETLPDVLGRLDARRVLGETGKSVTEIAKIWCGDPRRALALVREVQGQDLFDAALAAGRGLIVAAPHLGCWELLNYWLAARTPLAIVYRPPRNAEVEPFLRAARGAVEVEQVRAEGAGVRTLYRRLAAGGVVGILPDQQPKQGEGEFAPFFGIEASTMVLVPRLAERTGATVLFAFAERLPRGAGFRIHLLPAPGGIADTDLRVACTALNRGVEDCVRLAPEQYQWHYKRYSKRPPGERNPYKRNGEAAPPTDA